MANAAIPGHGEASDVVMSGLSGRLPESDNIEEFAQQLFAGVDMVTDDGRRWTPGRSGLPARSGKLKSLVHFDAAFFGVHAKQAQLMDPQLRLLLEVTHEALVDAGLCPAELRGSRTGVYVGAAGSECEYHWNADADNITGYAATGCTRCMFANRVSYTFDFKGPSMTLDTACASSMFALVQAVDAIRNGHCDAAVVAGTHVCLDPHVALNFQRLKMLSPEGRCAAFDASGRGYVRAEAVVAVLLQRRRDARRVYCAVRGASTNNDGYKTKGITYPAGEMQRRLATETFEKANLQPQDVVYVEAHGTGTKAGDPEELNAVAELYCAGRRAPLLVGSVKSNMGHAEPASGLCAVAKVLLAMERGLLPPNLHYHTPNINIPALRDGRIKVVRENTPWSGGLVALNSFGFGGANAHVVLEGGRGRRPPPAEYPAPRLVLASGRTDEAVRRMLELAASHPRDAELHALIDAVHARAISGHPRRGYAVLDPVMSRDPVMEVLESDSERPIWFVFSGVGSQGPGAGRALMRLPVFAASIAASAAALAAYDVDLRYLVTEAPEAAFDDVINCFVCITAIQVALVDVLRELRVHPDGIVGSSCGEIGCAYADGTLTAEQAVLCAYWRGRSVRDAAMPAGAMAAVGAAWHNARQHCSADIQCACYNTPQDIVISGPCASIEKAVASLSAAGVFARELSPRVAFHSSYCAAAAPALLARLREVIPDPKPRSARWLSTSVPPHHWGSDLDRLSDAAYQVNNLVSPVRLAEALGRVPARALAVELAPHSVLQAALRRALPDAALLPLLRRAAPDPLHHLLAALGKLYAFGAQPQVSRLYPAVPWPVSRGTPSLAPRVRWDHAAEWPVADFDSGRGVAGASAVFQYDLAKPEDAYIAGHCINGRVLFPATGYLAIVWRAVAKLNNLELEKTSVVLENVKFRRATIMEPDAPTRFCVTLPDSGSFEISEGGEVVATGTVRLTGDPTAERLPAAELDEPACETEQLLPLESGDIYKVFRLTRSNYKDVFRGIKSADARFTRGLLQWSDNWIAFMDTMMQFYYLSKDRSGVYLPTRLQRAVIDPVAHRAAVAAASGGAVPIRSSRSVGVMVAGGVELRGVNWSLAMRRVDTASPKLEEYVFIPLVRACVELEARRALAVALQLVVENCRLTTATLKLFERALRRPTAELLLPHAITVLAAEPGVRADAELLAGVDAATYADAVTPLGIKVSNRDTPDGDAGNEWHVALGSDVLARGAPDELRALGGRADFVLLHEAAGALDADAAQHQLDACGLTLVSRVRAASREYVVLRRVPNVPATKILIEVHDDDFTWVDNLKVAMKRAESEELRVVVWSRAPDSGVLGLGTCLRREPGGARLRVYHVPGAPRAFTADAPPYDAQVQRDLAFNVLRSGVWGTYRHLPLEHTETLQPVEHAYVNTLTRGDLSSLRWVESDMPLAPHRARAGAGAAAALCRVHCAPLNFRDVMLATGKLPPDALPGHLADQECVLGLEFSGLSSTGKRVMGMVPAKGLATTVLADESFTWEVPTQWSLEEAATVPVAYATAYYALVVRGRMQRGESVLVHAGAGGVGQAAIAVALHAGCTVYTTVGSPAKRAFLRDRFPQLLDASIGNSRDCSFEQLVLRGTRGRGVDLVLNSLAGDKLQASVRCLAEGGRFLEIGKVDLSADSALGMAVLLKNTTVHGILLDALQGPRGDGAGKAELGKCMAEGITAGVVRPLPATIFAYNQLEEAFRYMSTGKHIGKVVIRVREEQPANERLLVPAVPRVYMHPGMSYVLVGGLGGFGLELCDWLVSRGARTVVLSSRSGVRTGYQSWCIRRWRSAGVVVLVSRAEAATAAGARALLREAAAAAPVGGVFHLAAVLRDALLENQTPDTFRAVAEPKINVARELDAASRELAPELKYFVVFSSVACGRGNVGQSNYGLANSGMERLVERRRAAGLPALAVQWGAVGDVGLAADTFGEDAKEVGGTAPQRIASCLETLERLLLAPRAAAVLASMVLADRRARDKSTQDLVHAVANILGIKDLNKVSSTATLVELGLDSLMVFEVKQLLERSYDTVLDVQAVRALTVGGLRDLAGAGPSAGVGPSAAAAATAAPTADAEIMPRQVLVKLPSLLPANSDQKLIFMVHPIEGVAEQLRGVAAHVRGAVLALQCTRAAPLADMAALASFYVEQVRSAQPEPPYTLAGYSFGASVAFEMALQLERGGCAARLVLLDGSPAYVADAIASALDKRLHTVQLDDVHLLAHSGRILFGLDLTKVASELEPLSSETARLSRLREMAAAVGVRVGMDELRDAVQTLLRRVIIAHEYRPAARLRGPVTLFRAQESEHDYGLEAACAGELRTRTLPATHRTIVTGSAARAVADHLSELLARH
ncbi:fatty acid synthase-like [Cydia fagiglandana]|uniref:fatty acid synthase-like n=1 Tax=Cydia fagiglandana TaxID=1458189 RepID=UPI002FEE4326